MPDPLNAAPVRPAPPAAPPEGAPPVSPAPINKTMTPVEWGLLLFLSVLWGGSFFFNGVAVRELPTLTIILGRVFLAAATLWLVLAVLGQGMPRDRRVWLAFAGMGLLNNMIPFSLIVWGQSHIASGVASILNATTPLFTLLMAQLFTSDEKLTPARLAGMVLGLAGVATMIGGSAVEALGVDILAQAACLTAALSYGCANVFGRRFRGLGVTPMQTATGQLTASTLLLLPVVMAVDQPWSLPLPSPAALGALLGLAVLSSALAYVIFFRILASAGATNMALVTLLVPVSAILLGVGLLGESLEPRHLLGMALIALGLSAIDGRLWRCVGRRVGRRFGGRRAPAR